LHTSSTIAAGSWEQHSASPGFLPLVWPRSARPSRLARLVADWARRGGDASPGLRPAIDSVRWPGLASDLLHNRDGTLAHERDGLSVEADTVARGPGRSVGCAA